MGMEDDIFQLVIEWEAANKVEYSVYPRCTINDSWIVSHPRSYSRLQTRNAFFLSSKYMPPVIEKGRSPNGCYGFVSFHGHQGGTGFDPSGKFETVDGMGMFLPEAIKYRQMGMTTHPEWTSGFMMLLDNYLFRFPKNTTYWPFWLSDRWTKGNPTQT